jgi:hypothetical protein
MEAPTINRISATTQPVTRRDFVRDNEVKMCKMAIPTIMRIGCPMKRILGVLMIHVMIPKIICKSNNPTVMPRSILGTPVFEATSQPVTIKANIIRRTP